MKRVLRPWLIDCGFRERERERVVYGIDNGLGFDYFVPNLQMLLLLYGYENGIGIKYVNG